MNLRFKWQEFISFGQQMELPKKTIIFQQGEEGKGFYYIDKGQIKITLLSDQGTERTIHYLAEGSLFGEQAYNGRPYLTTAIVTKPSIIYFFNQAAFQQICKHEPQAIHIFMHSCIAKVRLLGEMTAILNSSLEKHLAYTIVNLYKIQGGSSITLDQTALAQHIGASRITVHRLIQQWKKEGVISLNDRTVRVNDINKLKQLIETSV